jgi:hypothetical protein
MLPLPRWLGPVLLLPALALGPWTLYLTYSLPSRHLTHHYDLAWVGFDIALLASFAITGWFALHPSKWLVPAAAVTGTMLLCDAWFDVITSSGNEQAESILEACLAELPLAALCAYVVWDVERFLTLLPGRRRGRR